MIYTHGKTELISKIRLSKLIGGLHIDFDVSSGAETQHLFQNHFDIEMGDDVANVAFTFTQDVDHDDVYQSGTNFVLLFEKGDTVAKMSHSNFLSVSGDASLLRDITIKQAVGGVFIEFDTEGDVELGDENIFRVFKNGRQVLINIFALEGSRSEDFYRNGNRFVVLNVSSFPIFTWTPD